MPSYIKPVFGASLIAAAIAVTGCGNDQPNTSDQPTKPVDAVAHPGAVERAAQSNAHREIPTKFTRSIQLRDGEGDNFLLVNATNFDGELTHTKAGQSDVEISISNIGSNDWSADLKPRAILLAEIDNGRMKRDVELNPTATCSGAASLKADVPAKSVRKYCLRFDVPASSSTELFKFSPDPRRYHEVNPEHDGYGVWALPGSLTEACRFDPSSVKGKCEGLEAGEKDKN